MTTNVDILWKELGQQAPVPEEQSGNVSVDPLMAMGGGVDPTANSIEQQPANTGITRVIDIREDGKGGTEWVFPSIPSIPSLTERKGITNVIDIKEGGNEGTEWISPEVRAHKTGITAINTESGEEGRGWMDPIPYPPKLSQQQLLATGIAPQKQYGSGRTAKDNILSHVESNPLNIRKNPNNNWGGKIEGPGEFEHFKTRVDGLRAFFLILDKDIEAEHTLRETITDYAPPEDFNDTENYIKYVAEQLGISPDTKITTDMLKDMAKAMLRMENSIDVDEVLNKELDEGLALALQYTSGAGLSDAGVAAEGLSPLSPMIPQEEQSVQEAPLPPPDWLPPNAEKGQSPVQIAMAQAQEARDQQPQEDSISDGEPIVKPSTVDGMLPELDSEEIKKNLTPRTRAVLQGRVKNPQKRAAGWLDYMMKAYGLDYASNLNRMPSSELINTLSAALMFIPEANKNPFFLINWLKQLGRWPKSEDKIIEGGKEIIKIYENHTRLIHELENKNKEGKSNIDKRANDIKIDTIQSYIDSNAEAYKIIRNFPQDIDIFGLGDDAAGGFFWGTGGPLNPDSEGEFAGVDYRDLFGIQQLNFRKIVQLVYDNPELESKFIGILKTQASDVLRGMLFSKSRDKDYLHMVDAPELRLRISADGRSYVIYNKEGNKDSGSFTVYEMQNALGSNFEADLARKLIDRGLTHPPGITVKRFKRSK